MFEEFFLWKKYSIFSEMDIDGTILKMEGNENEDF